MLLSERGFHGFMVAWLSVTPAACSESAPAPPDPIDPPSAPLVLDYTAYVDGAVQVSGVGVSRSDGTVALVTDFEKALLIDPQTVMPLASFSVQLGDIPEQGSSEAISFLSSGDVAVLYPEHKALRVYAGSGSGEVLSEVDLSAIEGFMHGAMTISPQSDTAYLIVETDALELVSVSVLSGDLIERTPLSGDIADEVTGLSLSEDGGDTQLWLVSEDNRAFDVEVATGQATLRGELAEVGEASGAEAFANPEGEAVLAISDDANEHNAVPGPIRLYLIAE